MMRGCSALLGQPQVSSSSRAIVSILPMAGRFAPSVLHASSTGCSMNAHGLGLPSIPFLSLPLTSFSPRHSSEPIPYLRTSKRLKTSTRWQARIKPFFFCHTMQHNATFLAKTLSSRLEAYKGINLWSTCKIFQLIWLMIAYFENEGEKPFYKILWY